MKPSTVLPIVFGFLLGPSGVGAQDAAGQAGAARAADAWSAGPQPLATLRAAPLALIPYPRAVDWLAGKPLVLPPVVSVAGGGATDHAALARVMKELGREVRVADNAGAAVVAISMDPAKVKDAGGYELIVHNGKVRITGHDAAGVFHAIQTLRQLLRVADGAVTVPQCRIDDAPAFALRGFMHDTGRNFQTIDSLKKQIDIFAAYKLNVFHWHLTDNPAWRPESRVFPQLNDPKFRKDGRNPEASYSFADIHEVIRYAKDRHVQVIPELDMPGHSAYFNRTFGFAMGTPQGMDVLEKLIDEFCGEFSKEDFPIIHLGADEVHIAKPEEFINRMTGRLRAHGRTAVLWNPGLKPADDSTILQGWGDQSAREKQASLPNPRIDSAGGYLNSFDPLVLPARYFFWQPCDTPRGDAARLGGVLCMWPDIRVDDKENIFRHSPVWPTLLAFSEAIWQGRTAAAPALMDRCPDHGSEAWEFLHEFENRMADHRDRYFRDKSFPWIKLSTVQWRMRDVTNNPDAAWKTITGTTANISSPAPAVGATIELQTVYHVDAPRTVHFWIGFDHIARSQRESGGVPKQGEWDANGGTIRINGQPVPPPVWNNPGKYRFEEPTWERPPNEIPLTDEELYWCREPVAVPLQKGANLVEMKIHKAYKSQGMQATCVPVKKSGDRWIEDDSVRNTPMP